MSQNLKYNSIFLKVNMKKSGIKKQDTRELIAKRVDLIRRKLLTLSRNFDRMEKLLRMSRPTSSTENSISREYNWIIWQ